GAPRQPAREEVGGQRPDHRQVEEVVGTGQQPVRLEQPDAREVGCHGAREREQAARDAGAEALLRRGAGRALGGGRALRHPGRVAGHRPVHPSPQTAASASFSVATPTTPSDERGPITRSKPARDASCRRRPSCETLRSSPARPTSPTRAVPSPTGLFVTAEYVAT